MTVAINTANWLFTAFALVAAIVHQALRPVTWRRPVRVEFWQFMAVACLRILPAILVAAALVGFTLISQALYWLSQFGQSDSVGEIIVFIMVRDLGPSVVGLLVLGSGGIVLIGELSALRAGGQLEALDRQGVDPFLLLIVPRVAALTLTMFVHSMVFIVTSLVVGYSAVRLLDATTLTPDQFVLRTLATIGEVGYIALPAKTIAIGLTIGAVCSLTALDNRARERAAEALTAIGFLRGTSGILLVSALISLAL